MNRIRLLSFVRRSVSAVPSVTGLLSPDVLSALKASSIEDINATYHDTITEALIAYFEGGKVTAPKNSFMRGTNQAFNDTFDLGYTDNGGELPLEGDVLDWINARIEEEFGHISVLFEQAKELRKDTDTDAFAWITERADTYTNTLKSIYNSAMLFAKKNQMLTWHLGATEQHCSTCGKLDGNSHRASWYISHDYIPRKPGASMDCGGWNCQCSLTDKEGNEVTL